MAILVIRTDNIIKMKDFFNKFGLDFEKEQHGQGPEHYACQIGNDVFEIYPEGKKGKSVDFLEEDIRNQ